MQGSTRAPTAVRLEEQLAEAQALTHIGSWDWEPGDDTVAWSDELYRIFGVAPDAATPRGFDAYLAAVHPDDREATERAVNDALAGRAFDHVERIVRPSGEVRVLRSRGRPILDDAGTVVRLVGTCQDITEEERLRRQNERLQRMDAVGRLAGGVAHDLNNLLTVILSYTQIVELRADDAAQVRRGMGEVRGAADSAAQLSRQLLMFARGDVTPLAVVDLAKVIGTAEPLLRRAVGAGCRLELDVAADLGRLRSSATQLEQVLMNLVINARDAMTEGGAVRVVARNATLDEARSADLPAADYVVLEVHDDGAGMSPEVVALALEPFFTTKDVGEGTGLGLSTVYGIVSRSGGALEIESEPGEGTTVRAWFPRTDEEPEQAAEITRSLPGNTGARVLVVESTGPLRELMGQVLTEAGYRARLAYDFASAAQLAAEPDKAPDVLVVDRVVRGGNGGALIELVRERHPHVALVVMNGFAAGEHPPDLPADAVRLAKPFTPDDLIAVVESAIGREG